jgi:hypothetical protein
MSRFANLKKRQELLGRLMDTVSQTSGEDAGTLMEIIFEIGEELGNYSFVCAKCGELRVDETTHQVSVNSFRACNHCGGVVKNLW